MKTSHKTAIEGVFITTYHDNSGGYFHLGDDDARSMLEVQQEVGLSDDQKYSLWCEMYELLGWDKTEIRG